VGIKNYKVQKFQIARHKFVIVRNSKNCEMKNEMTLLLFYSRAANGLPCSKPNLQNPI